MSKSSKALVIESTTSDDLPLVLAEQAMQEALNSIAAILDGNLQRITRLRNEKKQLVEACRKFLLRVHHAYHIPGQTKPLSGRECLHCGLKWHADDEEEQHDRDCPVTIARAALAEEKT